MSKSNKGQLVKFSKGKRKFEVVTKPGTVLKYRNGKLGFGKVLMADQVFTNSVRGDIANAADLLAVFKTENVLECCEKIVSNGDLQYTAEERKQFMEQKTNAITHYIHKNYIDPKSNLPHPADRILNCMKECKIRVDPKGDSKQQAEDAVKKMRGKLMFAKAISLKALLTIKHAHVGQCTNLVKKLGNVTHTDWTADGCVFTLECSKADMDSLQSALMKPTNGDYNMQFCDESGGIPGMDNDDNGGKKKGKKKHKKDKKKKKHKEKASSASASNEEKTDDSAAQEKKKKKKKKKHKKKHDGQTDLQ